MLSVVIWISYRHKKRIREAARNIREMEEQHRDLRRQLAESRSIMEEDRQDAEALSSQIAGLEREKQALLTEQMQWEQQKDDDERKKLSALMEEKEAKLSRLEEDYRELSDHDRNLDVEILDLKDKESRLRDALEQSWSEQTKMQTVTTYLLDDMKNGKINKCLSQEQWKMLFLIVNKKFKNYEKKLRVYTDQYSKDDIELCCLIKLGFTKNEEIATFLSVQVDAVKRRKQRLKKKLGLDVLPL